MVFIRYTSFGFFDNRNISPMAVDMGRWPIILNAIFNGVAHYLFIFGMVMVFLPVFMGKLNVIRDIYASSFFRPFARTNFTNACF